MRKPWFRKQTQCWYVYEPATRRQLNLGPDKGDAFKAWHAMQVVNRSAGPRILVLALAEAFMDHAEKHKSAGAYAWLKRYLAPVVKQFGARAALDLSPFDFSRWLDARTITPSVRRAIVTATKAAYNWGVEQGVLPYNPLAKVKRPPLGRREQLVDRDALSRMLAKADAAFRQVLVALSHTGCRPADVRAVTGAHLAPDGMAWVFDAVEHKTGKKTGRKRIVHLTPCLATLCRILAASRARGPLFLNTNSVGWTANAIRCRMRRLRQSLDLPPGVVAYSFRHTWTTDALVAGVDVATVAELLGHRDTSMIDRHYGHLDQRREAMQQAVAKVRRATAASSVDRAKPSPTPAASLSLAANPSPTPAAGAGENG